jgi:hypothetical protein
MVEHLLCQCEGLSSNPGHATHTKNLMPIFLDASWGFLAQL